MENSHSLWEKCDKRINFKRSLYKKTIFFNEPIIFDKAKYRHNLNIQMESNFEVRNWTLELEPDEPAYLPVPDGCECVIQGIYATDTSPQKIVLDAKIHIIHVERIDDETDIAPTEIVSTVLATIFPSINPSAQVKIAFSPFNKVAVCATGGKLTLNGCYDSRSEFADI